MISYCVAGFFCGLQTKHEMKFDSLIIKYDLEMKVV